MMRRASGGWIVSVAFVSVSIGRSAWATDPASATMLFNEARRLAAAHRYREACPKFEESQRLDPGIGTQFNLADCYEHTERIASAWALFLDVASSAGGTGQEAREAVARRRAAAIEPKLSKLSLVAPHDVPGLQIRRNGELVDDVLWNTLVPVDTANYSIEASAPHKKSWSTIAVVGSNAAVVTVTIPELEADVPAEVAAPPTPGDEGRIGASSPPTDNSTATAPERAVKVRKVAAIALGAAGLVGVAVGTVFGLKSITEHSDYEKGCTDGVCSSSAGPIHDEAVSAGNASTIAFVVGGALVAGGVALWVTLPAPPKPKASSSVRMAPMAGPSTAGAVFMGEWR